MTKLPDQVRAALERLIAHAQRETGQSRRVADFLLAWWNAGQCGGFDFTTMWGCDDDITDDMARVFHWVAGNNVYPDTLGYGKAFEAIVTIWRPELVDVVPSRSGESDYDRGRRAYREGLGVSDSWGDVSSPTKEALDAWMRGYGDEQKKA